MSEVKKSDVRAAGLVRGPAAATGASFRVVLLRSSWRSRAGAVALAAGLGACLGLAAGLGSAWLGAALALAALAIVALAVLVPGGVKLAASVGWFLPVAAALGFTYTSVSWGISPYVGDAAGGAVSLMALLVVSALASARWSRGAAWRTVLLAEASLVFVGLPILFVWPQGGLWAAVISVALVTALRCGAWTRVRAWVNWPKTSGERPGGLSLLGVALPDGVFAESLNRGQDCYLVVGPGGIWAVAAVKSTGPARESRSRGLEIPGIQSAASAVRAVGAQREGARLAGVPVRDVVASVVVSGGGNENVDRLVGVYVGDEDAASAPAGVVRVMGVNAFLRVVQEKGRLRRGRAVRVARLAFRRNARRRWRRA